MNSSSTYSPFIEHSFRRLTLLIHQQDVLDTNTNKITDQSSDTPTLRNNICNSELISFSSKIKSHPQSSHNKSTDAIETKVKVVPMSRTNRTYMRPPKSRITMSSQVSDRLETSFNHSFESPCSPAITKEESNELPVHMPCAPTPYDIKFERDRQNDVRRKYDVPPPFQRKWLRQPRYTPQERPNFGQNQ